MKILFLTEDRYPPVRVDTTILLAKEIAGNLGHEIDWIMQSENEQEKSTSIKWKGNLVYLGATDIGTSFSARLKKGLLRWKHDLTLFKACRKKSYDIVQVKDRYLGALLGLLAAKWHSIPFIFWISYPEPEASIYIAKEGMARYKYVYLARGHIQKFILYKLILRYCDLAIVQSEQMKLDISREGIVDSKMKVMEMGYDQSTFANYSIAQPTDMLDNTISYLGSMGSERRLDFLVRVLKLVHVELPNIKLLFIGSGDREGDEELILSAAKIHGVSEMVTITGRMPQNEALTLVRRTSLCLSPFYPTPILNSTSPTKLIEYMALEMPVVANDHPEQKRVIESSGCGICVKYDESEFAKAVVKLMRDKELRQAMGKRGLKYARHNRSYDLLANKLDGIYQSLIAQI